MTSLAAFVDGVALPEAEARALWDRFSLHMDSHKGDLGGFARAEGFTSVRPETRSGRAVLVASRTAAQQAYGQAGASPRGEGSARGESSRVPGVDRGVLPAGDKSGGGAQGGSGPRPGKKRRR